MRFSASDRTTDTIQRMAGWYISSVDVLFFSDRAPHKIDQLKAIAGPFYETTKASGLH
jgi:hypothetical protein